MANDLPLVVPNGVVEELIEAVGSDGVVDLDHGFQLGDVVRLREGPFAGFVGVLRRLDDNGRVQILLGMMNSTIRVSAERSSLEPAR